MLQQPLARRVAGAARYAAAGEALPGALPLSSMASRTRPTSCRSNRWAVQPARAGCGEAPFFSPGDPSEQVEAPI